VIYDRLIILRKQVFLRIFFPQKLNSFVATSVLLADSAGVILFLNIFKQKLKNGKF